MNQRYGSPVDRNFQQFGESEYWDTAIANVEKEKLEKIERKKKCNEKCQLMGWKNPGPEKGHRLPPS